MIKKIILGSIIILFLIFIISRTINKPDYTIDSFNKISFSYREKIRFEKQTIEENKNYTLEKIIFESKGEKIYSHIYIPNTQNKVPALVYLPAAGATKEAVGNVATEIVSQGYAVMIIDMRGIGETKGMKIPLEQEYEFFKNNEEPQTFKSIYDSLLAFEILYEDKRIDPEKITFLGESLGGRIAIIAAALEKRSTGSIVFSTAGFRSLHSFIILVDPDTYVSDIAPRKIVMFHSLTDSVVPFDMANSTFSKAKQPKELIIMQPPCDHGWCFQIEERFFEELNDIVQKAL